MLEVVLVYLFCQRNVKNAELRGQNKGGVIASTIFLWLLFEIVGMILGWKLIQGLGYPDYGVLYMAAVGVGCGLIGAHIANKISLTASILPTRIPHDPVIFEFDSYEKISKPCRVILHRDKDNSITTGKVDFSLNGEHISSLRRGEVCVLQTYMRKNVFVASKNEIELPTYPYTFVVPEDGEMHVYFNGFEFDNGKTFIAKGRIVKEYATSETSPIPPINTVNQYSNQVQTSATKPCFCQYCGKPRSEADKFCRFCGAGLAK